MFWQCQQLVRLCFCAGNKHERQEYTIKQIKNVMMSTLETKLYNRYHTEKSYEYITITVPKLNGNTNKKLKLCYNIMFILKH